MGHDNANERSDTALSPLHLDGHEPRGLAADPERSAFSRCAGPRTRFEPSYIFFLRQTETEIHSIRSIVRQGGVRL